MATGDAITARMVDVAGVATCVHERAGGGVPVILWHGVPNTGAMWAPLMHWIPGPVHAPDLPGFGHSARPAPAGFDGSLASLVGWAEAVPDALGLDRYSLVVHDWGAIGLLAAARHPERIERIVAFNSVPFEGSYEWHWVARIWRRRGLGEMANARTALAGPMTRLILRQARPGFRAMPGDFVADCLDTFDEGTSRAILNLYRSADPEVLAREGQALRRLEAPAKVLWGEADPYIPARYGRWLSVALGGASQEIASDAGHWPWIDRPDLLATAGRFVGGAA